MKDAASLISAIAALVSALSWPVAACIIVFAFRQNIVDVLQRAKTLKLGSILEAELKQEARPLVEQAISEPQTITTAQIESTTRVELAAKDLDDRDLLFEITRLCSQYENIRAVMPAGQQRTNAMTEILVQMRILSRSIDRFLPNLKSSNFTGERLAAIAIMQVQPHLADLDWLLERFREDAPFIFFHAAVAISGSMRQANAAKQNDIGIAARTALDIVKSYNGIPDENTIRILEDIAT